MRNIEFFFNPDTFSFYEKRRQFDTRAIWNAFKL